MTIEERIAYLQTREPESLLVQSGVWQFCAWRSELTNGIVFRAYYRSRGDSSKEVVCSATIPYFLNDEEFKFVASYKRMVSEKLIESVFEA